MQSGRLDAVKWIRNKGYTFDPAKVVRIAVYTSAIDVLKYFIEQGFSAEFCKYKDTVRLLDTEENFTAERIARVCDMIRYLRLELHIPWKYDDFGHFADTLDQYEVMELALQLGCPMSENTILKLLCQIRKCEEEELTQFDKYTKVLSIFKQNSN